MNKSKKYKRTYEPICDNLTVEYLVNIEFQHLTFIKIQIQNQIQMHSA